MLNVVCLSLKVIRGKINSFRDSCTYCLNKGSLLGGSSCKFRLTTDASGRILISLIYDYVALNIYAANYFTLTFSILYSPDGIFDLLGLVLDTGFSRFGVESVSKSLFLSFRRAMEISGFFRVRGNLSKL